MKIVNFLTSNRSKFQEVDRILGNSPHIQLLHHQVILPELQAEFDEIVINKCMTAATIIDGPVLVDDAGLSCEALNGLPGPYTKDFILKIGLEGLIQILSLYENKAARAICTLGYTEGPNKAVKLFTGSVEGTIIKPTRMSHGSCFDAIFQPNGANASLADLPLEEKNKSTHRYKALMLLKDFLTLNN